MDEVFDDAGAGELLQVEAWLAELDAQAFDVAHVESLADQVVDPHAAHHDLAPGLRSGQADNIERFGLYQGQRFAGTGTAGEEVAVALQAVAGDRADGADRAQRIAGADVDGLDMHGTHHPGWPASPPTG